MTAVCIVAAAIRVFLCTTPDPIPALDQSAFDARFGQPAHTVNLATDPYPNVSQDVFLTRVPDDRKWLGVDIPPEQVLGSPPERKLTRREWRRQQRELRREARREYAAARARRKETVPAGKNTGLPGVQSTTITARTTELAYATPNKPTSFLSWLRGGTSNETTASIYGSSDGYRAVVAAAKAEGVDQKLALSIAKIESGGKCGSVSSANAVGVMQIKPGTAKLVGYTGSAAGLRDCKTSAKYGMKYLAYCSNLAGGDVRKTALCYNQGHGTLISGKYRSRANRPEFIGYKAKLRAQGLNL